MQLANIKEKASMLVVISSFVMPDGFFFRNVEHDCADFGMEKQKVILTRF
jgi:hypothetical protein